MKPRTHFAQRCVEHGVVSINGDVLKRRLQTDPKFSDPIIRVAKGTTARAFVVDEGTFYAITDDTTGIVMTLYTQAMINRIKKRNKRRKKSRSHKKNKLRH